MLTEILTDAEDICQDVEKGIMLIFLIEHTSALIWLIWQHSAWPFLGQLLGLLGLAL
jgi:hypothetical protein